MRGTRRAHAASCRAFTLIELLVVVAIIALLIAILLPSLSRAREQGKAAVCLSNMRNLMLATQMYEQTHGGRFPSAGYYHGGQGNEVDKAWIKQLARDYGKQRELLRCPSDESPFWTESFDGNTDPGVDPNDPDSGFRITSYASNGYTVFPIGNRRPYSNRDRIPHPSTTIFWAELVSEGEFAVADHLHPETWWSNPRTLAAREVAVERHGKQANYAFVDGHAESLPFKLTYQVDPAGSFFPPTFIYNKYDPEIAR